MCSTNTKLKGSWKKGKNEVAETDTKEMKVYKNNLTKFYITCHRVAQRAWENGAQLKWQYQERDEK